eukprot:5919192-Pleurochrysis_carterae.AAC.1
MMVRLLSQRGELSAAQELIERMVRSFLCPAQLAHATCTARLRAPHGACACSSRRLYLLITALVRAHMLLVLAWHALRSYSPVQARLIGTVCRDR